MTQYFFCLLYSCVYIIIFSHFIRLSCAGKALCLLTKSDLGERSPGNGDVLHNVLQMLIRDSRALPSSPLTPQFPLTPSWSFPSAPAIDFPTTPTAVSQLNSVTLSPAPSVDSQAGSPRHHDHPQPYPALNS